MYKTSKDTPQRQHPHQRPEQTRQTAAEDGNPEPSKEDGSRSEGQLALTQLTARHHFELFAGERRWSSEQLVGQLA
ncbi:MAG: hypothetical protein QM784_12360 [Polyangiaceae bacterium]